MTTIEAKKLGYTKINNKILFALIIGYIIFLSSYTTIVYVTEYFSSPQIINETIKGGQIINVTQNFNKYVFSYWDGKQILEGTTIYKIQVDDIIYVYNLVDSINIKYIYSPRIWEVTTINNEVITSTQTHDAITLLNTIHLITASITFLWVTKYVQNKQKNKVIK